MDPLTLIRLCERASDSDPPEGAFWIDLNEIQCLILDNVVAFAGTNQLVSDWLRNLDFKLVANVNGRGKVHRGFKRMSEKAWEQLWPVLTRDTSWVFTGHSQGAAVASLCAQRAANSGLQIQEVVLFGSPKFGNQDFACSFQLPYRNYVNGLDCVPKIALCGYSGLPVSTRIGKRGLGAFAELLANFTGIHKIPAYKKALS